jgi:Leucine-rich repeat (LRR) protein
MKKLLLILLCLPIIGFGQNVNIPDANFKAYLVANTAINTNGDTAIQVNEATAFSTYINCTGLSISDLTGIEAFTSLTSLMCHDNQLTSLDLSNNIALTGLHCGSNQLTSLNLSDNDSLYGLTCNNNQLTSLDLSQNTALTYLNCFSNFLTSLDLRNGNNFNFNSLNTTNNPNLYCIDVDSITNFTGTNSYLDYWNNFSYNCALEIDGCTDSLALNFNPTATFNDWTCDYGFTTINDANFEQTLIDLGIDTDSLINNSVATANIRYLPSLNLHNKSIGDLTGIEDFISLTSLWCSQNNLITLDLSSNILLTELICYSNQLTTLNINNNTALTELLCYSNQLTSLDVSNDTLLTKLLCMYNPITSLDLSSNIALEKVWCHGSHLTNLNLNNCINLTDLRCSNTHLSSIDLGDNLNLERFRCSLTNIDSIDVSHCANLRSLHVFGTNISSLNINNNSLLEFLSFDNLDTIDISHNLALRQIINFYGTIQEIDVTQHTQLESLHWSFNNLTKLDLSNNHLLKNLDCAMNQIDSLNLTNNVLLESLSCGNNSLTYLDLRNGNNHNMFTSGSGTWYCGNLNFTFPRNFSIGINPLLYCTTVDNVTYSDSAWAKDPWNTFSSNCQNEIDGCTDTAALNYDSIATINSLCDYGFTDVPDSTFEYYLETHNIVGGVVPVGNLSMGDGILDNDSVLTKNIRFVLNLNLSNYTGGGGSIQNLIGIEDFISLTTLNCTNNQLTSLDVSQNLALTTLNCTNNQLTSLDVNGATALTSLNCDDNQLTSLDVSANTALTRLICDDNQLTSLDVNNNTVLIDLWCNTNQLTSLDVSQNTALTSLHCDDNQLDSLNVSGATALTLLYCTNNQLTSLDIRNGNNINFSSFSTTNNPNLYCIDVDDPVYSTANWTSIDSWMNFSGNCLNEIYGCMDSLACNYDSLVTINDNSCVYPIAESSSVTICDIYTWEGQTVTTSQILIHVYTNLVGCDSTHTLSVTINNSTTSTDTQVACDSYIWSVNGSIYTSTVIDTAIGLNAAGCTETNILDLTIINSTASTTTESKCDSYTWSVNGSTYTSTVIDTVIGFNAAGCTETNILDLTIINSTASTTTETECDSYTWNGTTYASSGTYTYSTTNSNGCDSTITLNLTIENIHIANISQNSNSLIIIPQAGLGPYSYFWSTGEITQLITPSSIGVYWAFVTGVNGCNSDTSFYNYSATATNEIETTKQLLKIVNNLGQETPYRRNTPLFYIYDDGTVEKRIVIE